AVHLYSARRPSRFHTLGSIPLRRHHCGHHLHVGRPAGDGLLVRAAGPSRAMEHQRDAVHVLDPRDRRHSGRAGRPVLGMKAPGAQMIASVTFIAVLMTVLIQAPTTKWLASKLKLLKES